MNGLGVVLETARRAQGMTQAELADAAGITQAALSRYENDLRDPEDDILERLADVLNLTTDFLRQAGHVRDANGLHAHMRRRQTARPSDWRRLEARLNMHRLHARRLFEEISLHTEHRLPTFDPFETDAATAATFVRAQWRMPSGPVRNLTQWVEAAGCVVLEEDFAGARVDGLSQWIDDVPVILLNARAPTDRKRLTLAHELGHLCLHSVEIGEDVEREANSFAAEFLMPMVTIRPQLKNLDLGKLRDLKRDWQVSMQALVERALEAGLITVQRRTALYKALSAKGWRVAEPLSEELAREHPGLTRDVGEALTRRGLSEQEIAQIVGYRRITEDVRPFLPSRPRLRAL